MSESIKQNRLLLTFKDQELEKEFKKFYGQETRLSIRIGIALSIVAWTGVIVLTQYVIPQHFFFLSFIISICTYPFFIILVIFTFKEQYLGHYQWMATVANGIAGLLIIFCTPYLSAQYADYSILVGLLIVLFFGYYILRLRFLYASIISFVYMGSYQVYLLLFGTVETGLIFVLSYCIWLMFMSAVFAGYVQESINRQLFIQGKIIKKQQEKIEKAYSLLSKYVAPQLADTIADGQIDLIWKHYRKKLTLFFSDIKDFTTITDSLEPEDMANVLNEYLGEMNTIINKYGGTLAQVIGDGLYVFFGAPDSKNDVVNAVQCVNMAIDMQRKMKDLNKKWFNTGIDELLQIRCGINTGMATVGGYGSSVRKEYTAMGMQTNIAARLEQACEPGGILISHTTWALIKTEIPCTENKQIQIKGYQKPVRTYSVNL